MVKNGCVGWAGDWQQLPRSFRTTAKRPQQIDRSNEFPKPPFSPEAVVAEFCQLLKTYHAAAVFGDRYAGEWPREQVGRFGIGYDPAVPRQVAALRRPAGVDQFGAGRPARPSAPRRPAVRIGAPHSRGGRDSIDHPLGGHDDPPTRSPASPPPTTPAAATPPEFLPSCPRCDAMIRAHVRGVAEVDVGLFPLR